TMAAPAVVRSSGPPLCPSFAEVCSFLERYGAALDLPEMTFPLMEKYLRDTTAGELSACLWRGRGHLCDTYADDLVSNYKSALRSAFQNDWHQQNKDH
uniref:Uncharacterized protein n=1 Tax=Cyprinodon variegatus TaxID=28743 RepID=A0A3Q2GFC8_CYPVA